MKISPNIKLISIVLVFLIVSMPFCFALEMQLTYDANGNLITGDGKYRTYNSLNQLWKVYNGTNTSVLLEEYTYHPVEERVLMKKVYNSSNSVIETTYYINQNYMQIINTSGTFNVTYYYLQGQLIAQDVNGVKTYFHTDIKGSVVAVTNSSGQVLEANLYSPTGEILSGGNKSRYQYEGKEYDKLTGQTDFNFRMYQSSTMQFTQPDTIIKNAYDPQSLNRYAFERNNPYSSIDPTGHWSLSGIISGINKVYNAITNVLKVVNAVGNTAKKATDMGKSVVDKVDEFVGYSAAKKGTTQVKNAVNTAGKYVSGGASSKELSESAAEGAGGLLAIGIFGLNFVTDGEGGVIAGEAKTLSFASEAKLASHSMDHATQMGYSTITKYEAGAKTFLSGSAKSGTAEMIRQSDGALVRYNINTKEFGVLASDGTTIKTYFQPSEDATKGYQYYLNEFGK
jgi:RHS repeat-associated protein